MCLKIHTTLRQYPSIFLDGLWKTTKASEQLISSGLKFMLTEPSQLWRSINCSNAIFKFYNKRNIPLTSAICPTAAGWHQEFVSVPSSSYLELYGEPQADLPASAPVPALHIGWICYTVQWHAVPICALYWTVGGGWMTQSIFPLPVGSDPPHQCLQAELCICSPSLW